MTGTVTENGLVSQLRSEFDASFGRAPAIPQPEEPVIPIRLAGDAFAIRVSDISGLFKINRIVPLPSRIPELLGLVAIRGSLIPVYDTAALLRIPARTNAPGWMVLAAGNTPAGLSFDSFEGQAKLERVSGAEASDPAIPALARSGSAMRAVLDVPGLLQAIRVRAGIIDAAKEKADDPFMDV